jgi:hypothetical protein
MDRPPRRARRIGRTIRACNGSSDNHRSCRRLAPGPHQMFRPQWKRRPRNRAKVSVMTRASDPCGPNIANLASLLADSVRAPASTGRNGARIWPAASARRCCRNSWRKAGSAVRTGLGRYCSRRRAGAGSRASPGPEAAYRTEPTTVSSGISMDTQWPAWLTAWRFR